MGRDDAFWHSVRHLLKLADAAYQNRNRETLAHVARRLAKLAGPPPRRRARRKDGRVRLEGRLPSGQRITVLVDPEAIEEVEP